MRTLVRGGGSKTCLSWGLLPEGQGRQPLNRQDARPAVLERKAGVDPRHQAEDDGGELDRNRFRKQQVNRKAEQGEHGPGHGRMPGQARRQS